MQYVILDLEWNGAYSKKKKKYINEIIEVGAVKVNDSIEIVDTFSMLVKPQIGKKISGRVVELTHISNDELSTSNNTYTHTMGLFKKFAQDCVVMTWGTTDISTMMDNNDYYLHNKRLGFLTDYIDLQVYCQNTMKMSDPGKQMGLETAAQLLGVEYGEDSLHRALDDSILSYKCFKKLYDKDKISQYIRKADTHFYDRIGFKNVAITDIDIPMLDKEQMYVLCDKCGSLVTTAEPWIIKNKSFRSRFHCNKCNCDFYGRITFKLKFDGVHIKRATYTPPSPQQTGTEEE